MNDINEAGTINSIDSVDSLFATDLAELADLADLRVPPVGRYELSVEVRTKDDSDKPSISIDYTVVAILEQINPEEVPAKVGDKFGVLYSISNEYGLGKLKKDLKPYSDYFNTSNIGELVEQMDGCIIAGTVRQRADKKNLDDSGNPRIYGSVVNVEVI